MRKELSDQIHKRILSIAPEMQVRLPEHPSHPGGRGAIPHTYDVIKRVMGKPARECRDCRFDDIMEIITFCFEHAEEMSIARQLYDKYQPEPSITYNTLDSFFES